MTFAKMVKLKLIKLPRTHSAVIKNPVMAKKVFKQSQKSLKCVGRVSPNEKNRNLKYATIKVEASFYGQKYRKSTAHTSLKAIIAIHYRKAIINSKNV